MEGFNDNLDQQSEVTQEDGSEGDETSLRQAASEAVARTAYEMVARINSNVLPAVTIEVDGVVVAKSGVMSAADSGNMTNRASNSAKAIAAAARSIVERQNRAAISGGVIGGAVAAVENAFKKP